VSRGQRGGSHTVVNLSFLDQTSIISTRKITKYFPLLHLKIASYMLRDYVTLHTFRYIFQCYNE
jgi:hypothetical protein